MKLLDRLKKVLATLSLQFDAKEKSKCGLSALQKSLNLQLGQFIHFETNNKTLAVNEGVRLFSQLT